MYLLKQRICSSPLLIHKKNKPTTKIYLKVAFPVKVMALTPLQKSVTSFAENYGNIVAFILWDFTGKDLMVCRLLLCSHGDNLLTHFGFSPPPLFYFFFFLSVCLHCVVYISHCVCCAWLIMSECRRINVCIRRSLMSGNWYFSFPIIGHQRMRRQHPVPVVTTTITTTNFIPITTLITQLPPIRINHFTIFLLDVSIVMWLNQREKEKCIYYNWL